MARWTQRAAGALGFLGLAGITIVVLATRSWQRGTEGLVRQLLRSAQTSQNGTPAIVRLAALEALESLPPVVLRYFRNVLRDGQPCIRTAHVVQKGEFRMREPGSGWRRFDAAQSYTVASPGFVWDARIRLAPLGSVRVRDAYVTGHAAMRAALLSLVEVMNEHDRPELDAGGLQRYLAEAVWFPTALLPSERVAWSAMDGTHARATLTDRETTVSLEFEFAPTGEIVAVYTAGRYRAEHGRYEARPWGGTYGRYEERGGVRVPLDVEVYWELDGCTEPYYKARLVEVNYD